MRLFELADELHVELNEAKRFLKSKGYILKGEMDTVSPDAANLARKDLPGIVAVKQVEKDRKASARAATRAVKRTEEKKVRDALKKKKAAEQKVKDEKAKKEAAKKAVAKKAADKVAEEKKAEEKIVADKKAEEKIVKEAKAKEARAKKEAVEKETKKKETKKKETAKAKTAKKSVKKTKTEEAEKKDTKKVSFKTVKKAAKEKETPAVKKTMKKAVETAEVKKNEEAPVAKPKIKLVSDKPEPVAQPETEKEKESTTPPALARHHKRRDRTTKPVVPHRQKVLTIKQEPRKVEMVPLARLKKSAPGADDIIHSLKQAQSSSLTKRSREESRTSQPQRGKKKKEKAHFTGVTNREELMNRPRLSASAELRQKVTDRAATNTPGGKRHYRKRRGTSGPKTLQKPIQQNREIQIQTPISIRDFSQETGVKVGDIIKVMMKLGAMVTINDSLDTEFVLLLAEEMSLDIQVSDKEENLEAIAFAPEKTEVVQDENAVPRPPVVVFMGHVDHGKTSLLDAIRKTNVVSSESGGITQHIGAHEVVSDNSSVTFIDTPGHEAFTTMRARGANVTDIAVLVVAADDGLMPQTLEAINHARAANVPILIAINKIDLPSANIDQIMRQLTEQSLMPEDWGGEIICCKVSAITGEGIDHLLEMIALQAEMLELKARDIGPAEGIVLEAQLDPGRGSTVNVIVQRGTLRKGDPIVCGTCFARARSLNDDKGGIVEAAGPSKPVQILGFGEVPNPGATFRVATSERHARELADKRRIEEQLKRHAETQKITLENFYRRMAKEKYKELSIVIKGDTQGTTEAVRGALERLSTGDVKVMVLHSGVGDVNDNDIMLASASSAVIIAFKVNVPESARSLAKSEGVEITEYEVIYHATETIQKAMVGLLDPVYREEELGVAEIRQVFKLSSGTVAGCYVTDGEIPRNSKIRVIREEEQVYEGSIQSLKRVKEEVKEVRSGYECGILLQDFRAIQEGDRIKAFKLVEVEPHL